MKHDFTLSKISLMKKTFRSLRIFNYRLWACGSLISNVGTWMQRTAQHWLVLTELTHHNAAALGVAMGLQSGPQILLLPVTGLAADFLDRRKLLIATQALMGLLGLALGILTLFGVSRLWHVYGFAFALGCVSAIDATARQTFVSELVGEKDLSNAVALNSTSMTMARMVGPAVAGLLIAVVGTGWVFIINAISFLAVLCSLLFLKPHQMHPRRKPGKAKGSFAEGFRFIWRRHDLRAVCLMYLLIGMFGLNFPIFISTMSVNAFHVGPDEYGLLMSVMAFGSVVGALLAAARQAPRIGLLLTSAMFFGVACAGAAMMPNYWLFAASLVTIGICTQTFSTTANSFMQLSSDPEMRGRVMAILLAIALGGTPIGAPIVGWVANMFGPRWALGLAAASGFIAALGGYAVLRLGTSRPRT